jgi:c-di-GMP-binding flagellar brake protein YcgR
MNGPKNKSPFFNSADPVQRRRHKRINSTHLVDYSTGPLEFSRTSKTLSTGGVYISTPEPLPIDTKVYMRIHFDRLAEDYIIVEGVVRYNQPKRGMGIQFSNLQDEDRKKIETRVSTHWWQEA